MAQILCVFPCRSLAFPWLASTSTVSSTADVEQLQKLLGKVDSLQLALERVDSCMQLTQSLCHMILFEQMGPSSSSSSSKAHNSDYLAKAISYYEPERGTTKPAQLRCMLTQQYFESDYVIAAHIYRAGWNRAFRKHMGLGINDPGNLLLLVGAAEKKFDQFQWTLKPLPPKLCQVDGKCRLMQPYKVLVLSPQLLQGREQHVAHHLDCNIRWADVQGRELLFGAGEDEPKPMRRACALHAMLAVRYAQQQGWLKETADRAPHRLSEEDLAVEEAAWASPTFNKARMDRFLNEPAILAPDD
eukprot:GHRQ01029971.1.p1 GENE.GHRQ01029971.1~~GHRQ01029971.1.p1  ORF type:complete len:301 (+),score=76.83 GHRQ01029971.1:462-1364(+)